MSRLKINMKNKERIINGVEELFFKFGIKRVTMDDVAKHLGMSKKTLYQFFKDKDELVHKMMQHKLKCDQIDFNSIHEKSKDVIDEVFGYMRHMTLMFSKMNPVVFYELQKYYPQVWKMFKDFKAKFILQQVEDSIERGKKEGLVRKDVNNKILSILRIEEIEMGMRPDVFPASDFSIVEVQLAMTEHFLYGICTLKGFKLIEKYKTITLKQ